MSDVIPIDGERAVSFIEMLSTGVVQTTSIARNGEAVHSRHTLLSSGFVNTQFAGTCRAIRG